MCLSQRLNNYLSIIFAQAWYFIILGYDVSRLVLTSGKLGDLNKPIVVLFRRWREGVSRIDSENISCLSRRLNNYLSTIFVHAWYFIILGYDVSLVVLTSRRIGEVNRPTVKLFRMQREGMARIDTEEVSCYQFRCASLEDWSIIYPRSLYKCGISLSYLTILVYL